MLCLCVCMCVCAAVCMLETRRSSDQHQENTILNYINPTVDFHFIKNQHQCLALKLAVLISLNHQAAAKKQKNKKKTEISKTSPHGVHRIR